MQGILFDISTTTIDMRWLRAAIRECIAYGEHGQETETDAGGHTVCFNCRGRI